jgi:hypothetical protein
MAMELLSLTVVNMLQHVLEQDQESLQSSQWIDEMT